MGFGPLRRLSSLAPKSLFGAPQLPIALDFGVGGLKVLQIAAGDPPTLVAAAFLPTPDALLSDHQKRFGFQIDALPRLIRTGGFKGNRAVCAIPASQTFCKHMQLQRSEGVSLETMVQVAVSQQLECDPAALVYRHVEVQQPPHGSGKVEAIVTAVPRTLVNRLLEAVKSAKLGIVGMHAEFSALLRAFDALAAEGEKPQTTLYLDIGSSSTKVVIAHGKYPVFARCVDLGGMHLDRAVASQLECEIPRARAQRRVLDALASGAAGQSQAAMPSGGASVSATAVHEEGVPDVDLTEPMEILTDEVQMCLRYHESLFPGQRVDRAVFVGGEARHRGMCQHVARVLRVPAQIADPMARVARSGREPTVGVDLTEPQPGWAVALGACLCPTDL